MSDLVNNISREFSMPNRTTIPQSHDDKPTSDTDRSGKDGREAKIQANMPTEKIQTHLDDTLREANFFLKNIGEWLV